MNDMQVVVDGLLARYAKKGKGPLVVLLHGWGDTIAGLAPLQQKLAIKHEVITIDLPGFGGTQPPRTAWGLSDYARFVQRFLAKIGAPRPLAVVGHSNGGAIAIRGLSAGFLQADKVVLIASAGIRGEYKGRIKALRIFTKFGKVVTSPLPKSVKNKLRHGVYKTVGSDMLVAEHLQETFKKIITDDVREDAAKLTIPTLLIYGEQDEQTPVWYGEAYHQIIPGSTLEIFPGAGHFVHLDRSDVVSKRIEEFLAG